MEPLDNQDSDYENRNNIYNTFVENIEVKDHAFDSPSVKKKRGSCDFPPRKLVKQIRGTQGPRFYNKITPSQQIAQFENISVDSML